MPFVYEPALLMIGAWTEVLSAVVSARIGCVLLAAGLYCYLLRECDLRIREACLGI